MPIEIALPHAFVNQIFHPTVFTCTWTHRSESPATWELEALLPLSSAGTKTIPVRVHF